MDWDWFSWWMGAWIGFLIGMVLTGILRPTDDEEEDRMCSVRCFMKRWGMLDSNEEDGR